MSSVMPVNCWIVHGMRTPGLISVEYSSTTRPPESSTMPASMTRSRKALPPVVSRSTQAISPARALSVGGTVQRQQRIIEIGTAVAKHTPSLAITADRFEIESRSQYPFAAIVGLRDDLPCMVRDEGMAVEIQLDLFPAFLADAIRGDERHHVGRRVALHRALPVPPGIQRRVLRLGADRRRIEKDLCSKQRHRARRLRKPLVPADRNAKRAEARLPGLESGVARREVEFLVVTGALGNVRLAVEA